MTAPASTTPFGRRPLSLAMVTSQVEAKECPADVRVHKWEVFRTICAARVALGLTDRALTVLDALLTFHQETTLANDGTLIVYPSNALLSLRAHGMSPATLRRHLAVLVEARIIIRRDSPNGKRFSRVRAGETQSFGFDLTPLVARVEEFQKLADAAQVERQTLKNLRERITLARRDIAKMIALGLEEAVAGDWAALHKRFLGLVARIPRTATPAVLAPLAEALEGLAEEVRKLLEQHVKKINMSANESHPERHIHNSKTDSPVRIEPGFRESRGGEVQTPSPTPQSGIRPFSLRMVLEACPDIIMYTRTARIDDWQELRNVANLVRGMLGISSSAYHDACDAMTEDDAAVVIAAILQKAEAISSPGGYLRALTEKARAREFSIGPVLMALLRGRQREKRSA